MTVLYTLYFNSRPSARGDDGVTGSIDESIDFNSRPSARGDACGPFTEARTPTRISIHAPPRGATRFLRQQEARQPQFQFTPLREGRLISRRWCGVYPLHFNSRPSARGDSNEMRKLQTNLISIHAPPRGATSNVRIDGIPAAFQFTPLREGRHLYNKHIST